MRASHPISNLLGTWRGKALLRFFLLLVAAAAVAAFASRFGVSHNYAYLHASLLAGAPGGRYHSLATRLATRGPTRTRQPYCRAHGGLDRERQSPDRESGTLRRHIRPGTGRHTLFGGCRPRNVGSASQARVLAASLTAEPNVSDLRRSAGRLDRDRSQRFGHRLSSASAI
jgi:hypothetical protein